MTEWEERDIKQIREWNNEDHPRGQPDNAGQFVKKDSGRNSDSGGSDDGKQAQDNVRQFKSGKEANNYFNKEEVRWSKTLSDNEKRALYDYTSSSYMDVNSYLRGHKPTHMPDKNAIMSIDNAIEKFELTNPIQVYRAVDINRERLGILPQKGEVLSWKGFTSTSVDYDAVNGDEYAMYIIDVPKGKGRGAYINSLSEYKDAEYEFLLKRGTKAKVTDTYLENGKSIIKLKVVD